MKLTPMLAYIGEKEVLSEKKYIFEPKLDGVRALCYKNKNLTFINRRGRDITFKYPEFNFITHIHAKSCILDGEIIVYDDQGNPNFQLLQKRDQLGKSFLIKMRSEQYPATYVVFDILMENGKSLLNLPLLERKKILEGVVENGDEIQKIAFTTDGKKLWKYIIKKKLEGVMAKVAQSAYYPGRRSGDWLKIKPTKTIDCIIVGFTHKKRIISSLVLAVYMKGILTYIGKVGTGFSYDFLKDLHTKLQKIEIKKAPIDFPGREKVYWVKPKMVCEVAYLELTKSQRLRVPSFMRLREDKGSKQCNLEDQM